MSSYQPKISIIIPSFNQGVFLEETILSVTSQNYKNFEMIIIDGGSSDNTVAIIKKHAQHVKYWISEKDNGQSHAINKGLQIASGEIITWLNSDDYYEKDTLLTVVNLFHENPSADIIHGKARLFGKNIKSKIIGAEQDLKLSDYLSYMRFPQPSSFFKKEFLSRDFPVNENLHYAMDFELVARAVLLGAGIKRVNNLLSNYRIHPASKSNQELKFLEDWAGVLHTIFSTVKNGETFAKKIEQLGLVTKIIPRKFACKIVLSGDELENIFLQHLHLQYHTRYRQLQYASCRQLSVFLKENYNGFYLKNNYPKYNFRLKFIPGFIFNLIRKP